MSGSEQREPEGKQRLQAGESDACPTACAECALPAEKLGRARFVRTAMGCVALCWGTMTLYPIYRYLSPKPGQVDDKAQVTSIEVCALTDLPAGAGKNFRFGSSPALVIHTDDGQLHAFNAVCTHLGCTVQYREDMKRIYCACHGGQYDPDTGKNVAGPPPKPLTALKVEVVSGKVVVSKA